MNWETIVGLIVILGLIIAIIVKSIIDKKKGKSSSSCGGNCSACNICSPQASKEAVEQDKTECEVKDSTK